MLSTLFPYVGLSSPALVATSSAAKANNVPRRTNILQGILRAHFEGFAAIVCCDMHGGDLLQQGKEEWRDQEKLGSYQPVGTAKADEHNGGGS